MIEPAASTVLIDNMQSERSAEKMQSERSAETAAV
jgi:hypothetical protein